MTFGGFLFKWELQGEKDLENFQLFFEWGPQGEKYLEKKKTHTTTTTRIITIYKKRKYFIGWSKE